MICADCVRDDTVAEVGIRQRLNVLARVVAVVLAVAGCGHPEAEDTPARSIDRYLVATITDSTFPSGALIEPSAATVFVTADTTFLVIAGPGSSEVFAADRSGAIDRQVGRAGEGPGEYVRPVSVMETSAAYLVLDDRMGRITHLSKGTLQLDRVVTIPLLAGAFKGGFPVAFDDGSIAVWTEMRAEGSAQAAYQPFHIFSPTGRLVHSFGADALESEHAFTAAPAGLATSGDTAVWTADHARYRIRRWDRTGNPLDLIERDVEWLPWPEAEPAAGQQYTRVQAIHEDDEGRLWVYFSTRRRIEQIRTVERAGEVRRERRLVLDPDIGQSGMIVEVLDPATGALVASTQIQGVRAYSLPGGRFHAVFATSASGQPLIEVWGFVLR